MSKIFEKIQSINKASLLPKGYHANNVIFRVAIGLVAVWLLIAAFQLPNVNYFVECKNSDIYLKGCKNPFYLTNCEMLTQEDASWCFEEYLPAEVVLGQRPGFFYDNAGFFSFVIMFLAIFLNHVLYNRDYKPEVRP